ncbi:MAG: ThiF family adenylyltransferase [Proteobacteria bacterium]|jgi:molybdopterin/thiamine biosynthesis adenylyltransferase|nr:ThiF family adenylyltransferase [Pseudomonadota bacterium]
MTEPFDYDRAFARNLGWVTPDEQRALRQKRVAIAGLGGVGGLHLLTLVRLGVGRFHLAEFDRYDVENFNRQVGATMTSIGKPKLDVMVGMARDVNPDLDIRSFDKGVNAATLEEFLEGVDLFVDGLDFFAFDAREMVFAACRARGIPAITVAPLGMGAALLNFLPEGMSFAKYFGLAHCPERERPLRFLLGLAPAMLHRRYLADMAYVDLQNGRGPSTAMACQLCAGVASTEALKLLLRRGKVVAAPRGVHFDAYRNRVARTWRPWGWRNPLQRVIVAIARRQIMRRN